MDTQEALLLRPDNPLFSMYPAVQPSSLWHKMVPLKSSKPLLKSRWPHMFLTFQIYSSHYKRQCLGKSMLFQITFSFLCPETSSKRTSSMIFPWTELRWIDCIPWIVLLIIFQDRCTICFFPVTGTFSSLHNPSNPSKIVSLQWHQSTLLAPSDAFHWVAWMGMGWTAMELS